MEHITADSLSSLFSPSEVVEIVKNGILHFANGDYHIPERMHINHHNSTTLIMPAFGSVYNCSKLVTITPENSAKGIPVINGILVLNKNENGKPLMTMDASMITALRTAGVGSIGLQLIKKEQEIKLGIIGLGVQGFWQTLFAASVKNVREVFCTTRNDSKFETYKRKIEEKLPYISIIYCKTPEEVVQEADAIITCTTAHHPVFNCPEKSLANKRFISVGSFKKNMQELPEEVYKNADVLIVDSKTALTEVGDVINAIQHNWVDQAKILTLADVLSGRKSISEYNTIVFKSVGMAAFDLSLATAVYEKLSMNKK